MDQTSAPTTARELRDELSSIDGQSNGVPDNLEEEIKNARAEDTGPVTLKTKLRQMWALIRPEYILDHLDWQSLKGVTRTWIQMWLSVILCMITRTNKWFGVASYVLNVGATLGASGNESIIESLYFSLASLFFSTAGLLFPVISNAINWRLHGYQNMVDVAQKIFGSGECPVGDSTCLFLKLLDGRYLQTNTTTVTIFMMVSFMTLTFYFTARFPVFRVVQMFGIIVMTVTGLFSNFNPLFLPWELGKLTYIPLVISFASRFFFACTVFPITSNDRYIAMVNGVLKSLHATGQGMLDFETKTHVGDLQFQKTYEGLTARLDTVNLGFEARALDLTLSRFEFQYSKFDSQDLKMLYLRITKSINILRLTRTFYSTFSRDHELTKCKGKSMGGSESGLYMQANQRAPGRFDEKHSNHYRDIATYELRTWDNMQVSLHQMDARLTAVQLENLFHRISEHYRPLFEATQDLLYCSQQWLAENNKVRFLNIFYHSQYKSALRHVSDRLQSSKINMERLYETTFSDEASIEQWLTHNDLDGLKRSYALSQDAFYGFLCKEYAKSIRILANWCLYIDETQSTPRMWFPFAKSSRTCEEELNHHEHVRGLDARRDAKPFEPLHTAENRNPDATTPQTGFHVLGTKLSSFSEFIWNKDSKDAVKKAWVYIIPCMLYFFRPTLRFAWGNRIVWAPVMTGLTMAPNSAVTGYFVAVRVVYTVIGAIVGMVAWYISTGNGEGNPFGYAAVFGVLCWYFAFYRLFANPMAAIVFVVTVFLVAGTSWNDSHFPQVGNYMHVGWSVAWRRCLTVLCGVLLAYIWHLPHPHTGKKAVRKIMASSLKTIAGTQSTLTSFALQRYDDPRVQMDLYRDAIFVQIKQSLGLQKSFGILQKVMVFEPSFTGYWPKQVYTLLYSFEKHVLHLLVSLQVVINSIEEPENIIKTIEYLGWSDPQILSDIYSLLHMTHNSLLTGSPLPMVSPGGIYSLYMTHLTKIRKNIALRESLTDDGALEQFYDSSYLSQDGRAMFAATRIAFLIYEQLDGIMVLVKGLVGEYCDTDERFFDWDLEQGIQRRRTAADYIPVHQ